MKIFDIGLLSLSAIGLIGLIILMAIDKDVSVLLPIVTTLLGAMFGRKAEEIGGSIKGLFVKK